MEIPAGKTGTDRTSVAISYFALGELERLLDDLHANRVKVTAKEDLVGALVLAARRSPIEATGAVVGSYWKREREIEAITAVAQFLRAYG
jgi:hypothetical protein